MKNILAKSGHFTLKGLGLLMLFFLFSGLTCTDDENYLYCTTHATHDATWPGDLYGFTWESNISSSTNYFRLSTGDHGNICPAKPVTLTAKVVAKDNDVIPPPHYIRVYWETDLGWLKWKSWAPLKRQSNLDNIWTATVQLGKLTKNFDNDQPANLRCWILMAFPSIDNTEQGDLIWLNNEFVSMEVKADLVLYQDRNP